MRQERHETIDRQIAYYRARAPEYDDTFRGAHDPQLVAALDAACPAGRVLELACGTGAWTRSLLRHRVTSITAVDAAPEMLELHARNLSDPRITRLRADLFAWTPPRRYDFVTFAFWLSHVPPARFADFWSLVEHAVAPGGRVFFVDQDARGAAWEEPGGDPEYPTVTRTLRDGRVMQAIKVFHQPRQLETALQVLGWRAEVRSVGSEFLVGEARR